MHASNDHAFELSLFPAFSISVQITTSGAPILGQNYSLTCCVSGVVENLNPSITYLWTKNNRTQIQQVSTDPRLLSFFPLRLSDAGNYTCMATFNQTNYTEIHHVIIQSELRINYRATNNNIVIKSTYVQSSTPPRS